MSLKPRENIAFATLPKPSAKITPITSSPPISHSDAATACSTVIFVESCQPCLIFLTHCAAYMGHCDDMRFLTDIDRTLFRLGWINGLNFPPLIVLLGKTALLGIHHAARLFLAENLVPYPRCQNRCYQIKKSPGRYRLLFQPPRDRVKEPMKEGKYSSYAHLVVFQCGAPDTNLTPHTNFPLTSIRWMI